MNANESMSDTSSRMPLSLADPHRKSAVHLYPHAIIGALAIITAWFNPLASHKRNPQTAQHHADSVASLLRADPRFQRIQVLTFTGKDRYLHVSGNVASKDDAEILRVLVASTKPPVRTQFTVFIRVNGSDQYEAAGLPDLVACSS